MTATTKESFTAFAASCRSELEEFLRHWLPSEDSSSSLAHACRYCVLGGGKRLRPALLCATAHIGDADRGALMPLAAAVELIHCYSLVHDDLPAMDDDDLRRGRPSCHIAFGEAIAILVGDALQAAAFQLLAQSPMPDLSPESRLQMIALLADSCGWDGMVGGQAIDIEGAASSLEGLRSLHERKTGALIRASIAIGALAGALDRKQRSLLATYGQAIGLAFQVVDDILDVTGSVEELGKPQGSDEKKAKITYPGLLGLDGARAAARDLQEQALDALSSFGSEAQYLRDLARLILEREN